MFMAAKQTPYTLFVVDDAAPINPREDRDNFGKMVCWHKRHNLGDEHGYDGPDEFLVDLCNETVPQREIFQMVTDNKFKNIRFEFDEKDKEPYHIKTYSDFFNKWYLEAAYDVPLLEVENEIVDTALQFLKISELLDILRGYNVILPLYLYDHSGLTMNTVGYSCPWDSGQVGWIYATYDDIRNEYGSLDIARAENMLRAEVEEYDYYLTGQCYGFKLYEGDNEIESIWGFYGDMSDVSKNIKEYLPSECKNIVDILEYQYETDEYEYLDQILENEDADDEMEI